MRYDKLISKKKQYKYSANVSMDLKDDNKLAEFIPNITTTEILKEYLMSIIGKNTNIHARILYGSYGTGKSHLLTVISAILGHININGDGFNKFIQSIRKYDNDLADDLIKFKKSEKPYLVVPIHADFADFDVCITYSLKKALEEKGIEICFKSYFDEAKALVKKWMNIDESKKRVEAECKKYKLTVDKLYNGLSHYEQKYEGIFNGIFKALTYGAHFVSRAGNLIDNIELVNKTIKNQLSGIVFVFDEFGRYIEDNKNGIKVKSVQNIAEYCDHNDYNNHIILISHKQLSLYTDRLSKEVSEEWKKVEGRFKSTSINIKYDQCLSLIPEIIPKTDKWDGFKIKYKQELDNIYNQGMDFKGFLLPQLNNGENPFEGGYPIHPITLYSLDRLSKKVAQNERTFFTYLSSDEENALFAQLKQMTDDAFHFVGLDLIFDYFETNIKSYKSNEVYDVYKKLQFALNKVGTVNENVILIKVLKALAVIAIISDTTVLSADKHTLINVIDEENEAVIEAIDKLEELKIIRYMRQYGFYDFIDSSIYNLDEMILEKMDSVTEEKAVSVLNDTFIDFALIPYDYNAAYHMNRVFIPCFVNKSELTKKQILKKIPKYYDGILALVLDNHYSEDYYKKIDNLPERTIMMVNKESESIVAEVKRYIAILYYNSIKDELKKDDPTVEKELQLYLTEQETIIRQLVSLWINPQNDKTVIFINKSECNITSREELSKNASVMMFNSYPKTVVINNDLINKNVLTAAMRTARNKALKVIMSAKDMYSVYGAMSPEHTILRSVLAKNGLGENNGVKEFNKINNTVYSCEVINGVNSSCYAIEVINEYIDSCQHKPQLLSILYEKLKQAPFGLRDGYMPVLFAHQLREYENVSLYFHGSERSYTADELVNAFNSPEDYSVYICIWSQEQEKYIEHLENTFADYLKEDRENSSRLAALLEALNSHYASVSKAARTTDRYVSELTKEYRDIIGITYKDYNKFFFDVLLKINSDLYELSIQIDNIKADLEEVTEKQCKNIDRIIRKTFELNDKEGIAKQLKSLLERYLSKDEQLLYDYQVNTVVDFVTNSNESEQDKDYVKKFARLITGFDVEYWSDDKDLSFEESLYQIKEKICGTHQSTAASDDSFKITIEDGISETKITQLDNSELSAMSKLMLNKLKTTVDNFGQGVTHEEKMRVIAKLLSELM